MTQKFKRSYNILLMVTLGVSLIALAFRTYLLLDSYDAALGYYDMQGGITLVPGITVLVSIVTLFLFIFIWKKKLADVAVKSEGIPFYFGSAMIGISMLAYSATLGHAAVSGRATGLFIPFCALAAVAALGACAYFIADTLEAKPRAGIMTVLSMCVCAFMLFAAFSFYFDFSVAMNSPAKNFCTVATLAVMIFFLFESRKNFGIPAPSCYVSVGLISLLTTSVYAIPNLIFYALRGEAVFISPVHDLMLVAAFLYILARLLLVSDALTPPIDRTVVDEFNDSDVTHEVEAGNTDEADPLQTSIFDVPEGNGTEAADEEASGN